MKNNELRPGFRWFAGGLGALILLVALLYGIGFLFNPDGVKEILSEMMADMPGGNRFQAALLIFFPLFSLALLYGGFTGRVPRWLWNLLGMEEEEND